MKITSNNGIITEIKATKVEFNDYVNGRKWVPQSKVLFFKQKDGYCMAEVSLKGGDKRVVKVIIVNYFA